MRYTKLDICFGNIEYDSVLWKYFTTMTQFYGNISQSNITEL